MARSKNLAGLATLAGLAYLASRDKGEKGGDTTSAAMDAMTSGEYGGPNAGGDIMTDKEPGWESGTAPSAAPASTPRARPRATSAATAPSIPRPMGGSGRGRQGGATAEELSLYAASKAKPKYQSLQDRARSYEEERAKSGVGMYGTRKTPRREDMPDRIDEMGNAYKKGGKVKGWGSARGARKAKIY